jgi:MFS family permease
MMLNNFVKLPKIRFEHPIEKHTFQLFLTYSFIDGIILGALALNEFILIKGLKGSSYQIGLLFLTSVIVLLFSVPFNEIFKRITNKKRALRITAIVTRVPLLILVLFPENFSGENVPFVYQIIFLIIFLLYYFANPLIMPAITGYLKTNFTHNNFGKFYGYVTTVNKIVMLIVTFVFGLLLDIIPNAYTMVYPILGVLGIISIFILTKIDYNPPVIPWTRPSLSNALNKTFNTMTRILKTTNHSKNLRLVLCFMGLLG